MDKNKYVATRNKNKNKAVTLEANDFLKLHWTNVPNQTNDFWITIIRGQMNLQFLVKDDGLAFIEVLYG